MMMTVNVKYLGPLRQYKEGWWHLSRLEVYFGGGGAKGCPLAEPRIILVHPAHTVQACKMA